MALTIEDLTREERIELCNREIDLRVRRMRAEKKRLLSIPSDEELQALWDEEVTPDDIRKVDKGES